METVITLIKCFICIAPGSYIIDRFYKKNGEFIEQFFVKLFLFWGGCAYTHWVM